LFNAAYGVVNPGFFINEQSGSLNIILRDDADRLESITVDGLLTVNTWYNFAIVLDNSTTSGEIKVYIDGVLQTTSLMGNSKLGSGNIGTATLFVGAADTTQQWFDGLIDDLSRCRAVI
jgi:hypothetical protein